MSERSWFYDAPPRRTVEGGVTVAKPGKVTHDAALDLVEAAEIETNPKILARGRTYARKGQVVDVHSEPGSFAARIQGSASAPYLVRLDRVTISGSDRVAADCSCPYGCDLGWCKHAAALAYVAAFLLDTDAGARSRWSGVEDHVQIEVADLTDDEVAALRATPPVVDPVALMAAAEAVVPYPRVV